MKNCPECYKPFNINSKNSNHQVNDNFDLTFCSYECSAKYTDDRVEHLYKKGLSIKEIINNI